MTARTLFLYLATKCGSFGAKSDHFGRSFPPLHTTPAVIIAIVIFVISFLIINDERLESTYRSIVPIHYVIPLFFYLSKALYLSVIKKDLGNICLTIVLLTKFFLKICVRKICFWKIHFKNTLLKNTLLENNCSGDTLSENNLSGNTLSENTLHEYTLSENTLSENKLSGNMLSKNTLFKNTLSKNTLLLTKKTNS